MRIVHLYLPKKYLEHSQFLRYNKTLSANILQFSVVREKIFEIANDVLGLVVVNSCVLSDPDAALVDEYPRKDGGILAVVDV